MTVYDKARELGNLLLESEEGKRLNDKRYIFDGSEESKRRLNEYSRYRESVHLKLNSGELGEEEVKLEQENLKKKIEEVTADPIISDMIRAEEDFANLVSSVMNIVRATIEGESEGFAGCSGNCRGCSGCR